MIILGLDLATHTGWSMFEARYFEKPRLIEAGFVDCSIRTRPTVTIPADPPGKRFHILAAKVKELCNQGRGVNVIYYERAVGGPAAGGAAAMIAIGMSCIVETLAFGRGLTCHSVATGTLKKHATGDGGPKTGKQQMIEAALHMPGWKAYMPSRLPTLSQPWKYDDNVVDALWVGHFGACAELKLPNAGR